MRKPLLVLLGFFARLLGGAVYTPEQLEQLKQEARTDHLTGILNRRGFEESLTTEFERSKRFGHTFSILFIDLDSFKEINDQFGHSRGDEVLRELTRLINQQVRKIDFLARLGGDEFVLVLPETTTRGAYSLAEKLRQKVKDSNLSSVTVSIGVASFPEHAPGLEDLLAVADSAVYKAKKIKNKVVLASK
ncbi:hypothetical protein A2797_02195 [candidate division WWE3 bacterium RIFCSPHIGHO2_01_FULL_48_15]|uniref:GGDEF domain-containing protein n=1 Tax=candidate division WWE3 bacterium RIFCSPHIGHO2_01_FULL_48_15 TaxID=1802619 RepID=A0A1F4VG22_UNCKA|nr:MAG: hypothetical protein A2797_02195 [candidate division WWE3 bacterium RIFCSPHIGHO2_01_FULL_48_15]